MIPYKATCPLCGNEIVLSGANVKTSYIKSRERHIVTCPHCDQEFGIDIMLEETEGPGKND